MVDSPLGTPETPGNPADFPELTGQVTRLLGDLRSGKREAEGELFSILYDELREIAGRLFASQKSSHTLQPTALLHEAYLKLARPGEHSIQDRAHFLNLAARAMRQILVNHARDRVAEKRGGKDRHRVTLHPEFAGEAGLSLLDLLALDEALEQLAALDPRQAQGVELRIFAGLSHEEVATQLGVSLRTVEGDWRMAKAWLGDRLRATEDSE